MNPKVVSITEFIELLRTKGISIGYSGVACATQDNALMEALTEVLHEVQSILLPGGSFTDVGMDQLVRSRMTAGGMVPTYDPLKGQVGGDHYKGMKIQHAEFCQANRIPWCESAAIKYLCRHKDKNGVQDVDKAIHYCLIARKLEYPAAPPYQLPGQ